MTRERNTLPKRVKRYAKVTQTVAKAGAKMAGRRLAQGRDSQAQAEVLRTAFGGLKGPIMKIAQLLGTVPDVLPNVYMAELARLQSDAPPMGWPFVQRRMAGELGEQWEKRFRRFEPNAAFAASLGQVHKALGTDGRALACKLQFPDMASVVEADLRQLRIVLKLFTMLDGSVNAQGAYEEIAERMREELDYRREARNIKMYATMLAETQGAVVPDVIDKLSTDRLLTMMWLDGEKLSDAADRRSQSARNAIAMNLFNAWYTPFYRYGVIHGDPHPGNYTVRPDNTINLLDFGCIRVFRPGLIEAVLMLYRALRDDDSDLAVEAYKAWGFAHPTKRLIEVLNIWGNFVYAPLLQDKKRPLHETNSGAYGREVALKVHKELRKIGGVDIPREFVFVDRASVGLGSVFLRLRANVNWCRLFADLTRDFDVKALAVRQKKLLKT